MTKTSHRPRDVMRPTEFITDFTPHALASVLVKSENTQVITTCSHQDDVPHWMRGSKSTSGWLTAEYSLLPSATHSRHRRERPHPSGRSYEIQRLISRSLRAAVDLSQIPSQTWIFDCDVISADGGTRTTSLNGCMAALILATNQLRQQGRVGEGFLKETIAAVSVALYQGEIVVDPDYSVDSAADADITMVFTADKKLVEIQGCAEKNTFTQKRLTEILEVAARGLDPVFHSLDQLHKNSLSLSPP